MATFRGTAGDDRLIGGPGADKLSGGAGRDTASYAGSDAAAHVDLSGSPLRTDGDQRPPVFGGHAEGDTLTSIAPADHRSAAGRESPRRRTGRCITERDGGRRGD